MSFMKSLVNALVAVIFAVAAPVIAAGDDSRLSLSTYNDRYNEIVQSYDIKAFLALYSNDPLWIAPNNPPVAGLDVPRNTLQFLADKAGVLTHTVEHVYTSNDGSQAVLIGQYDAVIDSINQKSSGTYLFVLARDGNEWDIIVDMFNSHTEK